MRLQPWTNWLIVAASAAVLAVVGPLSVSLSAQFGVIYACVQPGSSGLRLVGETEACKPNEVKVQWNVAGPKGDKGDLGPQGAQGPRGFNGANGTNGTDGTNGTNGTNGVDGKDGKDAPTGGISGQLTNCNGASLASILVHVPGRAFSVFTGTDGKFQIDLMPTGTYDLSIEVGGAVASTVTGVAVGTTVDPLAHSILLTDTKNDPNNCGACGVSCGGGACVNGACQTNQCAAGKTSCNGACVDLSTDASNCGVCGTACGGGVCAAGICTCAAGQTACGNGVCTNITSDPRNCGGCGIVCQQGAICNAGACVSLAQCSTAADCGVNSACQQRTCNAGMCGVVNTPAFTVVSGQIPGDCKSNVCDGAGNITTIANDADVQDDGNSCTTDICTNGVASHVPVAQGAACNQNGGTVCNGAGACVVPSLLGNGAACISGNQCQSGICGTTQNGAQICAALSCGTCQVISNSGATCINALFGTNPGNACSAQAAASCGMTGACDSNGACQLYAAGTVCAAAFCSSGTATQASLCNGAGTCVSGGSQVCAPFTCNAGGCVTSCIGDGDCTIGNYCNANQCVAKLVNGALCSTNTSCVSGVCLANGTCQ